MLRAHEGSTSSLQQALSNPIWDEGFWIAFSTGESQAREALEKFFEKGEDGECTCETCIVRTVLESVWPILTQQVGRIIALNHPVQTVGSCKGSCRCRKE